MKKENVLYEKSFSFSIDIVKLCKTLKIKKEFVLSEQLLKSGTSIGANVSEANGAISKADFSSKISIAYKECLETKYWLDLLLKTNIIGQKEHTDLFEKADELAKLLFSVLKSTRFNRKN
ncbi:MAG: four helix bundle protein [Desulfuromonas sp. SDB]|nr:MAG: four helix bundle protein [Desulfuromonas sp. SDB]